ncbi:hypothetical protein [Paenisporosarcina cavernae]|uniref:Uncharacterized protein n=1 Tax=Paenisporosarcina cavernae TaxID=2320858 RepID=A0A385YSC9_9BACL|nr:hypothetical protein [Paenisporosarcina cavernae]AYC28897.1 hypothetical protein D3873_03060 [Paenisporosarcina cavernae]
MERFRFLLYIALLVEGIMALPILGYIVAAGTAYLLLVVSFVIHVINFMYLSRWGANNRPAIMGIVSSVLGFIPFIGFVLHVITFLMYLAAVQKREYIF